MKMIVVGLAVSVLLFACNFGPVVMDSPPGYFDEVAVEEGDLVEKVEIENTNEVGDCTKTGCPDNSFCYHSQYGGMGPNGLVVGDEEGDLKCHLKCENDNDCDNNETCQDIEILGGDLYWMQKFCLSQAKSCELIANEIGDLLNNMKYCNNNDDCVVLPFFGCPFGCYTLGNKQASRSRLIEKQDEYLKKGCPTCPERLCEMPPPQEKIICEKKKCIEI